MACTSAEGTDGSWREPCVRLRRDVMLHYYFFFQAEDGIRDYKVTGVQTCALPIWRGLLQAVRGRRRGGGGQRPGRRARRDRRQPERRTDCGGGDQGGRGPRGRQRRRSGEGRVGEEGRSRWGPHYLKKKKNKKR